MNRPVQVEVVTSRWVYWYVDAVIWFCRLTGFEPDMDKVGRMIERGIKVR